MYDVPRHQRAPVSTLPFTPRVVSRWAVVDLDAIVSGLRAVHGTLASPARAVAQPEPTTGVTGV
jgi:hypothetical protein